MVTFPNDENRTTIIGKTGSGKTVFGIWLLATCVTLDWKNTPVVIFDFKGDKLIRKIEQIGGAKEWPISKAPPKAPGLYIVRPFPGDDDALREQFLRRMWAQENIGLFVDEGYELAKSRAYNAILTQGRSKKIPCITLLQRPSWAPRFCFTEAQYFGILRVSDNRDVKTLEEFISTDLSRPRLPYHALWYDDGANAGAGQAWVLKPVPSEREILEAFRPRKNHAGKRML